MPCSGCSVLHEVSPNFKKFVSFGQLAGEKSHNTPNHEQGYFERNLSLQLHILHSMRSHSYPRTYKVGVITNLGYLRYYNNLEKLTPSVLISIDLPILIFSAFRAFIYCVNELFWSSGSGDWKITS